MASDDDKTPLFSSAHDTGELVRRRWRIEVSAGPDAKKSIAPDAGPLIVGSDPHSDLVLDDPSVSRRHARLELLPEGVLFVDLGSRNGVRIGNDRVARALILPGGTVRLGNNELRIHAQDSFVELPSHEDKSFGGLIARSPAIKRVIARARVVARSNAAVLIEGERGSGKTAFARAIHRESHKSSGPLIELRAGEIDAELEAFRRARGGTAVIEDLEALPVEAQAGLQALIEAADPRDVRIIATTSEDVATLVRERKFREDLWYRIAVVRAKLPPLRERAEDLLPLAERFAKGAPIDPRVLALLDKYDWPGNVRELQEVVESGVPEPSTEPQAPFRDAKEQVIAEFEIRYVRGLIERHGGNVSTAAKEAGLTRNALYALMKRAGL